MIGLVIKCYGRFYTVQYKEKKIDCVLRGNLKKNEIWKKFSEPLVTGDLVDFELSEGEQGVILEILERKNIFSRKDKISSKEDPIAANLDQIIIIQSFKSPRLNLRFVDRLLVKALKANIPAIVCINKSDLATLEQMNYVKSYYAKAKEDLIIISLLQKKGLEELGLQLKDKTSLLVGFSGVGKTSLLNHFSPGLDLRVSEVSKSTNKGKHTTTNVQLLKIDEHSKIIDSPGVREFGIVDIEPANLKYYFREFNFYNDQCNFHSCTHDHEPKCEVKNQVAEGNIFEDRYVSYLHILHSLQKHYKNLY